MHSNLLTRALPRGSRLTVPTLHSSFRRPIGSTASTNKPAASVDIAAPHPSSTDFLPNQFFHNGVSTRPYSLPHRSAPPSAPSVSHQGSRLASAKVDDEYFTFPYGTRFSIPTRASGLEMASTFAHALKEKGVVVIDLEFVDERSHFMLQLVEKMGGVADSHSSNGTSHTNRRGCKAAKPTRSHGTLTTNPQRFFGIHVLHPDLLGGGIFRVLPAADLISLLSPSTVSTLLNHEFTIHVPAEFHKSHPTTRGRLLSRCPQTGHYLLRFRRDILASPPSRDPKANAAVEELNALLDKEETKGWRFADDVYKANAVVLMDNAIYVPYARFLHMRTEIKDKRRLLRRVRFNMKEGETSVRIL
ncbi:hypothetical protein R3P38DRAFT_2844348 [Favolaschia claudopus]|uniref:Uncharacterized protein n=1 Tax=Favolaschia claudopus TaxID=2862362 RepID=A0AAW0E1V0_9AGAR